MSKVKKIIKISLISLVVIALIAYVAYAMIMMSKPDPEARCASVELVVKENSQARFITEKEVEEMLRQKGLYPKGELMISVDTKKIEDLIRSNDFIEKVECYKTSDNKLCVNIEQRTPILYVMPNGADGYFVDAQGNTITRTNYVANLITATGSIDKKFACGDLKDMAIFIENDDFWNSQVEQIYVSRDKKNNPQVEIVPRVGEHIVKFGSIDDFEKKFAHLKEFYQKALNSVGWNKYDTINLTFDNQVICTKKE